MPWSRALVALVLVALTVRDVSRAAALHRAATRHPGASAIVAAIGGPLRTLRGRIESLGHHAIGGAAVEAILVLEGRTYPLADVVSQPDGSFALPALPEGSYWLLARAPGRARHVEAVRIHLGDPPPLTITLGPGAGINGSVMSFPARQRESRPLGNMVVRASPDGGGEGPPFAVRTDSTGAFTLEGLAPGSYRVEVAEPGYEPVVRRAVPAPARGLAFLMRELASLHGIVVTASGAPAIDAQLMLAGSGIWPARTSRVQADGRFEIVGIPSGVYELRASAGENVAEPVAPLTLEPGDAREVNLTVTPGVTLEGTVVDAVTQRAIASARVVIAEDALATAPRAIVADASGHFRATGLLRRPHQVSARSPGYVPRVGALAVPGMEPVVIGLDRQVALTGRVVDGHGNPIAGAQIEVMARDLDGRLTWLTASAIAFRDALFTAQSRGPRPLIPTGELGVMPGPIPVVPLSQPGGTPGILFSGEAAAHAGYVTDSDGRFRIEEVAPGTVTVIASHPAFVRGETAQRAARAGEAIEVEIVLHEGGTIDGRLIDERGYPVSGQPIEVRSERDPLPRRAFSGRDGTFRIPGLLGRLAVVALVGGRIGARTETEVTDGAVVPVTLTLDRGVRRVRGRVVDGRGYPVAGAEITLAAATGAAGSSRTLSVADGTFDTMVAGTGAFTAEARHPEFAPRSVRVADSNDEVRIALEAGSGLGVQINGSLCATGEIVVELRTTCGPLRRTVQGSAELRMEHLCAGRVTAVASAPGCVRGESAGVIPATGRVELARIDLFAGGSAAGEVIDLHGDPVPGAIVSLASASAEATVGTARSDRRGAFVIADLPDGDQQVVATHAVLGRSRTAEVRILRGTMARGLRLQFDRDVAGAVRTDRETAVVLIDRDGQVEVHEVAADSPAARAGLQPGDVVLAVRGVNVSSAVDAQLRLAGPIGDEVALELTRDGVRRTVRWVRDGAR